MARKGFVLITAIFAMLVITVFASGCLDQTCVECDGTGTISRELRYQVTDDYYYWDRGDLWIVVTIKNMDDRAGTFVAVGTIYDDENTVTRSSEAKIGRGVTQEVYIKFTQSVTERVTEGRYRYYVVPEIIHSTCPECRGTGTVSVIPFSL